MQNATVPVIETGSGNCHIYIDEYADLEMGLDILFNAKTQRPRFVMHVKALSFIRKLQMNF